jgi:hypothetical protein
METSNFVNLACKTSNPQTPNLKTGLVFLHFHFVFSTYKKEIQPGKRNFNS